MFVGLHNVLKITEPTFLKIETFHIKNPGFKVSLKESEGLEIWAVIPGGRSWLVWVTAAPLEGWCSLSWPMLLTWYTLPGTKMSHPCWAMDLISAKLLPFFL